MRPDIRVNVASVQTCRQRGAQMEQQALRSMPKAVMNRNQPEIPVKTPSNVVFPVSAAIIMTRNVSVMMTNIEQKNIIRQKPKNQLNRSRLNRRWNARSKKNQGLRRQRHRIYE